MRIFKKRPPNVDLALIMFGNTIDKTNIGQPPPPTRGFGQQIGQSFRNIFGGNDPDGVNVKEGHAHCGSDVFMAVFSTAVSLGFLVLWLRDIDRTGKVWDSELSGPWIW